MNFDNFVIKLLKLIKLKYLIYCKINRNAENSKLIYTLLISSTINLKLSYYNKKK